jgi:hypothetical protein
VARCAQGYEQAHAVGVVVQLADVGAFSELAGSQGEQDGPDLASQASDLHVLVLGGLLT